MIKYRDKLYSGYVSTHTSHLYGELTIQGIKSHFPIWDSYFKKFLPKDKLSKILDIGCGNGGFVYWLKEQGYNNACGIDVSDEQVEIARKLGIQDVEQAEILELLTNKENSYDVIFARDVLEHFTNPSSAFVAKIQQNDR